MDSNMDEVTREFLAESQEGLDAFDRHMVDLETQPTNADLLTRIFRIVHTIKGTCGFLGFTRLEELTHNGENLLSRLRDGKLVTTPAITTALLALGDGMRTLLGHIERDGVEPEVDFSDLVVILTALAAGTDTPAPVEAAPAEAPPPANASLAVFPEALPPTPPPDLREHEEDDHSFTRTAASTEVHRDGAKNETSIRVDVGVLDKLMNLVGEMVLTRNQILQLTGSTADATLSQACQRLNLLTSELQEGVMKTRMQPIGQVWNRFPRLVRDVSLACGKQVRLEMNGKDTELDRTILEAIRDPLVHILRNAIDHGIESADGRRAAGKLAEGTVKLLAWHEGGLVHIEISDDGGGIDPQRVLKKAVERGLVAADARLSEREILNLVFRPGFSTAAAVTSISGRGVGMDVVKSNVEKVGGTVDIRSTVGLGSTFRISIPLTLAIIPVLIVTAGPCRYAIPQVNLVELVRVDQGDGPGGIERVEGCRVHRLRGQLLPVIDLAETLQGTPEASTGRVNLVVVQAGGRTFGIRVGAVCDTEEIVVKAIDRYLQGLPCYAGVTILGDGTVALILDAAGLARIAALHISDKQPQVAANDTVGFGDVNNDAVLLLGIGGDRRVAIPLSAVARIEEVAPTTLEHADGHPVIQYRGQILPLISLVDRFGDGSPPSGERVPIVVHRSGAFAVGLVGDRILDVVPDVPPVRPNGRSTPGIRGSAVIRDRVTDVLDIEALVAEVMAVVGDLEEVA